MAIRRRGHRFYAYFRPFKDKKVGLRLDVSTRTEAKLVEATILRACRTWSFAGLEPISREAVTRLFRNQGWEFPEGLVPQEEKQPSQELTLWNAVRLFLADPHVKDAPNRWRYECALANVVEKLGKGALIKSLWVPRLKQYQAERLADGVREATINREISSLSRVYGILIELQLVEHNPCRLVKPLSTKSGEREVYLSLRDFNRIIEECPVWFQRVAQAAFYTGMRRGELLNLTRSQLDIAGRMIRLKATDTKEAHPKRIPIHRDFVPILEDVLKVQAIGTDKVFLLQDKAGVRPVGIEASKNPWGRAVEALNAKLEKAQKAGEDVKLLKPQPRFHDLRHTWRTNARRSGVDPQIADSILGHAGRRRSVSDRYGHISDQELIQAIDKMTFDHGETVILVSERPEKKGNKKETRGGKMSEGRMALRPSVDSFQVLTGRRERI